MSTSTTLITAEDLWKLPGDQRRELVRGELRVMAPAGFEHGAVIISLARLMANFVIEHDLGMVLGAETGFVLARNPDVVRGADVAFVAKARIPNPRPKTFFEGAPDLAVEVMSPGDTLSEVEDKVDDYLNAGTRLVWVVNPRRKTIAAHRPGADLAIFGEHDVIDGGDVLPGFSCAVAEAFV